MRADRFTGLLQAVLQFRSVGVHTCKRNYWIYSGPLYDSMPGTEALVPNRFGSVQEALGASTRSNIHSYRCGMSTTSENLGDISDGAVYAGFSSLAVGSVFPVAAAASPIFFTAAGVTGVASAGFGIASADWSGAAGELAPLSVPGEIRVKIPTWRGELADFVISKFVSDSLSSNFDDPCDD